MSCNNVFCIAPWVTGYIKPDGNVFPCSAFLCTKPMGNIKRDSFESMYNSENLKRVRLELLNGIVTDECNACSEFEKSTDFSKLDSDYVFSFRQYNNKQWEHYLSLVEHTQEDGSVPFEGFKGIELASSSLCNFKCVMCSQYSSSEWVIDANLLSHSKRSYISNYPFGIGGHDICQVANHDDYDKKLDELLSTVECIRISGGEPLVIHETFYTIDKLTELNKLDTHIVITTNLSKLYDIGETFIEKLKLFNNLVIEISIDGSGKRGEYIRHGLNYAMWLENMQKVKCDFPGKYVFKCTVNIFNVWHIPEFVDELIDNNLLDGSAIDLNVMTWPHHQIYKILPNSFKKELDNKYVQYVSDIKHKYPKLANKMEYIRSQIFSKDLYTEWKDIFLYETQRLDKIRGLDFLSVCPELKVML